MNPQAPNSQVPPLPGSAGPYPEFSQPATTPPVSRPHAPGQSTFESPNYSPQPSTQPSVQVMPGAAQQAGAAPQAHTNPNSTQNALEIAEIRDGIVIMNDGSFRSVVMVKSINFDLMSQQEQEAVEYSYQGFLNSLYFPVQIFIRSQKVDLEPYIQKLDRIRGEHDNMLLAMLMEDYIGYIDKIGR